MNFKVERVVLSHFPRKEFYSAFQMLTKLSVKGSSPKFLVIFNFEIKAMMVPFFTTIQIQKMDTLTPPWEILKGLLWLLEDITRT